MFCVPKKLLQGSENGIFFWISSYPHLAMLPTKFFEITIGPPKKGHIFWKWCAKQEWPYLPLDIYH